MGDTPFPGNHRRWGNRIIVVLVAAVAVPLGIVLLYNFSPSDPANSFFPGCTLQRLTGLHCPGCGATRCCHALIHGDLDQALAWNPVFVLMLPFLIYSAFDLLFTMWTGRRPFAYRTPGWAIKILAGVLIAFWIVRNIPVDPENPLAPHKTRQTLEREGDAAD